MTDKASPASLWRLVPWQISAAVAMGLVACAVVVVEHYWSAGVQQGLTASAARLAGAKEGLRTSQQHRTRLEAYLVKFDELVAQRFVATPDRLALLEAVEKASGQWPKGMLRWEIDVQKVLRTLNAEATGEPMAEVRVVPMKLAATGVHEEEWLRFLLALEKQGVGQLRIDACEMKRDVYQVLEISVPAVNAVCNLSWVFVTPQNGHGAKK